MVKVDKRCEKYKHLVGANIDDWTILDLKVYEDKQHVYSTAQHKCGLIKEDRLTKILNNRIVCSCEHADKLKALTISKYSHLVGTKINGWSILKLIPPDETHRKTFALCECVCGTTKEVKLSDITNEHSKNCGCGRKDTLKATMTNDLVGQRFGKLVAINMLDERDHSGRIVYKCKCDCGNEIDVPSNRLTTHHTTSCGCLASYWNLYIGQFLKNNKIAFKPEHTVHIGDSYYRYDFYLPQYNLFIEYDGKQHYEPVRFFGDANDAEKAFQKAKEHDEIKNLYCHEHNINLLRIPYWESKNIETIISDCLQRLSEKGSAKLTAEYATV